MNQDELIALVISKLRPVLREQLKSGKRFEIRICGVQSKVTSVRVGIVNNNHDGNGFNIESHQVWPNKDRYPESIL